MTEKAILFICHDLDLADRIARDLGPWAKGRIWSVATVDDAVALGDLGEFALILLYLDGSDDLGQVDALLWSSSTARAPVPVIALRAVYDVNEALTYFQMGVTEYLSLSEHRQAIPSVVRSIIAPQQAAAVDVEAERLVPAWEMSRSRAVSPIF
jgi:hypothetical protein